MRIQACYDSHVHWAYTGEQRLSLHQLASAKDVNRLQILDHHRRGEWILGSGWDESAWPDRPHRFCLDQLVPKGPVAFTRIDGHSIWTNTLGLKIAGLWSQEPIVVPGGEILRDIDGWPSGVLVDQAAEILRQKIPAPMPHEMRRNLLRGMQKFNRAGFTHIRDMTCDLAQWNESFKLDDSGLLSLAVEEYFWLKSAQDFDTVLLEALAAKKFQSPNLRLRGLKIFLDGALGSEGAYISKCYHGSQSRGHLLWSENEMQDVMVRCWAKGLQVAVHTIGDQATHDLVRFLLRLKEAGSTGPVALEHCELMDPETVRLLPQLQVECHLQPSHWLTDRHWLKEKIGDLAALAFPWRALQESQVPFYFGSDSPIEPSSVERTLAGIHESAEMGIPRLLGDPFTYMRHSDLSWAPNSFSVFKNNLPVQVVFRGDDVLGGADFLNKV